MKLKKVITVFGMLIILGLLVFGQTSSYAAVTTTSQMYLGLVDLRTNSEPNMGYAIGNPNANQAGQTQVAQKIWNVVKYSSSTSNDPTEANIYCVKSGVGFHNTEERATYNAFFNMMTEREAIKNQNEILKALVEDNITVNGQTVNKYNALLAIFDLIYINGETTDSQKAELLKNAKIYSEAYDFEMTVDDIMAVQQAAIWYFTNNGEADGLYDKTAKTGWLNYSLDGNDYTQSLMSYKISTREGQQRAEQAELLYNYLIETAGQNSSAYANVTSKQAPAVVQTTKLNYEASGNDYIVGPIRINSASENVIPYTIDFSVKNGSTNITNYKLLKDDKTEVSSGTTVKDLVNQDFYISVPTQDISSIKVNVNINYANTELTLWASTANNEEQPVVIPTTKPITVPVELEVNIEKPFDLALRKYITKVNGVELTGTNSRVPTIDLSTLSTGTTATYKHKKDPITISTGDKVTYKLTVYNEGEKAGRATKIVDQLPTGLKFNQIISGNFDLDSYNESTNTLNLIRKTGNEENLSAYTDGNLDEETIEIECEVIAKADQDKATILTNVAWISEEYDAVSNVTITNQKDADRDSEPSTIPSVNKDNMSNYTGNENKSDLTDSDYYYKGQQDDDDFEKLVLMPEAFDLKLIKRIVAVNNQNVPERIEKVDVSKLNTLDEDGNMITTGDYKLNKEAVGVKKGDIVTYTFRIYNEGMIDGYASEITEDVPEGLEFIWSEKEGAELEADETLTDEEKEAIAFNQKYLWGKFVYDTDGEKIVQISTEYLSKDNEVTAGENLIPAFGANDGSKTEKDMKPKEISVMFKVVSEDITGTTIRNEACISEDTDKDGDPVDDRDSDTEDWKKYEDDEDYDNIVLQSFDLALRKFIIAVSHDTTIEESEYLKDNTGLYKRAPVVDTSKLNTIGEDGKLITTAIYNHSKEPIVVTQNDIVIYMLRVYNEADMDGYASEIKDHLPSYLEFVDSEFNEQYGWELSEDQRTVTTRYLENRIITHAKENDEGIMELSYEEVPIMCKVKDNAKTSEKITNIADITEYLDEDKEPVLDRDSEPDNVVLPDDEKLPIYKDDETGNYVPGQQDDDDFEKVIVKVFDLALRKWVTQAIVTENGQTIVTDTGHQPYDDPEDIVKVELNRKNLANITVKFRYSIRVINEGEIAGYAKEVTDYIPEGLRFVAADNPGWVDEGNNVISTRLLENTLLQPGEYADVEVILTWINNQDNMGLKVNTAEISEDDNEYKIPDRDSTPDNKKDGEDDIDDAPVMLSISTGQARIYFTLGFIVLITVAGGVVLIKKYII